MVRAATTSNLGHRNHVSDAMVAHYVRLARGGLGMIVTDAMRINAKTLGAHGIAAFREDSIPGLSRLADAVHAEGVVLVGQANHSGRQHTGTHVLPNLVGPSAIACPRSGGVPHPLAEDEVDDIVNGFVSAAVNLHRAGFDGVELNGAQGHLLQQFLSPFSNKRDDSYGGSAEKRAVVARTIISRIRERVSPDFVVGYRLGVEEFTDGGLTTDMTAAFARTLEADGLIDYVSMSQGNFNSIAAHLPDRHYPPTPFADVQRAVAVELSRVVRIACTRIRTPDDARRLIDAGWADAVAMSRALTADPDWPRKAQTGDDAAIRPCVQCNFCWSGQHEGTSTLQCIVNPEVGRELEIGSLATERHLVRSMGRKLVVVVGGGPAGMEAASEAARSGHRVVLFEKSDELGGKAGRASSCGGHTDFPRISVWLAAEMARHGVEVRLRQVATVEEIVALAPDHVIVATGATPVVPEVRADGTVTTHAELSSVGDDLNGMAFVVVDEDGHYWAAQVAEEIAGRGAHVVVMTRFFEVFRELPVVSRIAALAKLDRAGAEMLPMHEIVSLTAGGVDAKHYDSRRDRRIGSVDGVLWVGPQEPQGDIALRLRQALEVPVRVIGDAVAPRRLRHAVTEGFNAARDLGVVDRCSAPT